MNRHDDQSQTPGREGMDAAVRAALERLRLGVPEHPGNRDLMARATRLHGRPVLNVRMLCRESGLSPTTIYKRFPWAVALLQQVDGVAAPASAAPTGSAEVISRQAQRIKELDRMVGLLRAELHQVDQTCIALQERLQGTEQARQAAVDAGRRRKEGVSDNVSCLRS